MPPFPLTDSGRVTVVAEQFEIIRAKPGLEVKDCSRRRPAQRCHDLDLGSCVERGNLSFQCKGRTSSESTDARHRVVEDVILNATEKQEPQ
jgi:hypothetical protein